MDPHIIRPRSRYRAFGAGIGAPMTERYACGCRADLDRSRYVELCEQHRREFDEHHARAAAEYRARHTDSDFNHWSTQP